ncbi:uncharacterized protein ARMOST_11771 [Armillaria ostoyae]|uniref:Uncharacterized protein n=1 Tax=Armillaria ostoyae TaxID=47428 RepID=A0A284RI28_ARMOS|nr:uncharacterized protein ARMOST_11771 [Armillaria ostoyae]
MSQEQPMEPSSPHSSHLSQQDYPLLPSQKTPPTSTWSKRSWMWGKKRESLSTVSTKRFRRSLLPDFLRDTKGSQRSLLPDPSPLPSPVLSSLPMILSLEELGTSLPTDLSSSFQTVRPAMTMPHTLPPILNMPFGLRTIVSPHTPRTDFLILPPGPLTTERPALPPAQNPRPLPTPPPQASATYNKLKQQIKRYEQERSEHDSFKSTRKSLRGTSAEHLARRWWKKQPPSIGQGSEPPRLKMLPSTGPTWRTTSPAPSITSQSGSSSTENTGCEGLLGDSLESLSILGWRPEPKPLKDEAMPEEWASQYMNIWHSRRTDLTTEVA